MDLKIEKGLRDLLKEFGPKYSIKMIDFEHCLYRDFGKYDLEVSGCNNNKKKYRKIKVYVWSKDPMQIVYKSEWLTSIDMLKSELIGIEREYEKGKK